MEIKTYMTRGVANLLVENGKIRSLFVLVLSFAIMEYSIDRKSVV